MVSRRENVDTCFVGVTKHPADSAPGLKVWSVPYNREGTMVGIPG